MDTFDIRKYITEQNIKEQEGYERRYAITFKDGSTEEVGRHISVSPEDVMGSLKKSFERQGKSVSDIKHLGIKPVGIYESDDDELSDIVRWAADNIDFELSPRMQDAIAHSLEQGIPSNIIKKQLSSKNPINIREEKDVIEPEEGADEKDLETENPEIDFSKEEENIINKVSKNNIKKLVDIVKEAVSDREGFIDYLNMEEVKKSIKRMSKSPYYHSAILFDEGEEDSAYDALTVSIAEDYILGYLIPSGTTEDEIISTVKSLKNLMMSDNVGLTKNYIQDLNFYERKGGYGIQGNKKWNPEKGLV